jgi:ssDNA-binding Zn-finger/Zn-ribbon topoisomerase 1
MALSPALFGAIAGGLGVLVYALIVPAKKCPDCGTPLPKFRKPANKQQAMWGGWTCPKCGIDIDRKGKKRVDK